MGIQSNFFTAFYSALGDPKAFYEFQKEMNVKSLEDVYLNSFYGRSSFRAVVLSVNPGSVDSTSAQQAVRVRPLDIHDFILPEPCDVNIKTDGQRKSLISLHPVAYSVEAPTKLINNDGEAKIQAMSIRVGDLVTCTFREGPASSGKMRGLSFEPMSRGQTPRTNMKLTCLQQVGIQGAKEMFDGGGYESLKNVSVSSQTYKNANSFIDRMRNSGKFSGFSDQFLAGLAANAQEESGLGTVKNDPDLNWVVGDPVAQFGKSETRRKRAIYGKKGGWCSHGYWQMNICPGYAEGSLFAKDLKIDVTTTEGKKEFAAKINDESVLFGWIANRMKQINGIKELISTDSAFKAGKAITKHFEKPQGCAPGEACKKSEIRGKLAEQMYDKYKTHKETTTSYDVGGMM